MQNHSLGLNKCSAVNRYEHALRCEAMWTDVQVWAGIQVSWGVNWCDSPVGLSHNMFDHFQHTPHHTHTSTWMTADGSWPEDRMSPIKRMSEFTVLLWCFINYWSFPHQVMTASIGCDTLIHSFTVLPISFVAGFTRAITLWWTTSREMKGIWSAFSVWLSWISLLDTQHRSWCSSMLLFCKSLSGCEK